MAVFVNDHAAKSAYLFFLGDRPGVDRFMVEIKPGARTSMWTSPGHVWLLRAEQEPWELAGEVARKWALKAWVGFDEHRRREIKLWRFAIGQTIVRIELEPMHIDNMSVKCWRNGDCCRLDLD